MTKSQRRREHRRRVAGVVASILVGAATPLITGVPFFSPLSPPSAERAEKMMTAAAKDAAMDARFTAEVATEQCVEDVC